MHSIECNPSYKDWHLFVSKEPSTELDYYPAMPLHVFRHEFQLGATLNTFMAYQMAFRNKADAVLYLDDDMVLSPDALQLCDWYLGAYEKDAFDAGICLCRTDETNDTTRPNSVATNDTWMGLVGQGYCVTAAQWHNFVKRRFWAWEPHYGGDDYDWAIGHSAVEMHMRILRPRLSRSQHTGITGAHAGRIFPQTISTNSNTQFILEAE